MTFITQVENRNVSYVQQELVAKRADANRAYLGIYPFSLALEQGDVDMCAVLLKHGLNLTTQANENAIKHATKMRGTANAKYREEAAAVLAIVKDEAALQQRYDDVLLRIEKQRAREALIQQRVTWVCVVLCLGALACFVAVHRLRAAREAANAEV